MASANGQLYRIDIPYNPSLVLNGDGYFVNPTTLINVNSISGWSTSGSTVTLTNPNANVGIGVTNPTCKLEVLGCAKILGELLVDSIKVTSIQVGDSSLHIISSIGVMLDPLTLLPINTSATINQIYTDPNPICCDDQGGQLFINCKSTSPNTRINLQSGRVIIGSGFIPASPYFKLFVGGTERVSTGSASTLAFIDLIPSTNLIPNASIEIGSKTGTGQIDFKKAVGSGPMVDFKGRMAYTDGTASGGFDFYTGGNITPQLHIHENGNVIFNSSGLDNNLSIGSDWLNGGNGIILNSFTSTNLHNNLSFAASKFYFHSGNVGIGTPNPIAKLDVNGTVKIGDISLTMPNQLAVGGYSLYVQYGILTERVKVAVANLTDWSDYTFADDYELLSLDSVEKYIRPLS